MFFAVISYLCAVNSLQAYSLGYNSPTLMLVSYPIVLPKTTFATQTFYRITSNRLRSYQIHKLKVGRPEEKFIKLYLDS